MSRCLAALAALIVLAVAGWAQGQDANEIVRQADQARRPGESFVMKIVITSYEANKAPAVNGFEVYVKGAQKTFVRFVSPARNVGQSLLALERDLWIYLPDAGKPVRIPLAQRLVGQVANGDIARTDYAGDYAATLLGTETLNGAACWVLDLKANSKDVTYSAIKYWVTKEGTRPMKAEFFAGTGTLLKTGAFDQYRDLGGHKLTTRLTLVDAVRKDKKSTLEVSEMQVRALPDKYFNKTYMKSLD